MTLVGAAGDYRAPEFYWFHQKSLGHIIKNNEVILGSSFAMVGNVEHCYQDKREPLRGALVHSGAKTEHEICFRKDVNEPGKGPITETLFFDSHNPIEMYSFEPCDSKFRGKDPYANSSSGEIDPINEFDPFSIIDPKHWRLDGSPPIPRKSSPGSSFVSQGSPNSSIIVTNFLSCALAGNFSCEQGEGGRFGDGVKFRTVRKFTNDHPDVTSLAIPLTECLPLEQEFNGMDDPCPDPDQNATETAACDLLAHALLLDENNIPEEAKWKMDVLDIISEIYGKVCPAFSKESASTVARLFSFYLFRAKNNSSEQLDANSTTTKQSNAQRVVWDFLIDELNTCKLNAKPIKFEWRFEEEESEDYDFEDDDIDARQNDDMDNKIATTAPTIAPNGREKRDIPPKGNKTIKATKKSKTEKKNKSDPKKSKKNKTKPSGKNKGRIMGNISSTPGEDNSVKKRQTVITEKHLKKQEFSKVPIQEVITTNEDEQRNKMFLGMPVDIKLEGFHEPLFYYEEAAESTYDFNLAIDSHWKIFGTVIGYCNLYYRERKAETFPRLYNTYYEDFLDLVVSDWKHPTDNEALRVLMGEFISETASIWLDSCLEASYIVSKSPTYRPPRPLTIGRQGLETNYFDVLPLFSPRLKPDQVDDSRT